MSGPYTYTLNLTNRKRAVSKFSQFEMLTERPTLAGISICMQLACIQIGHISVCMKRAKFDLSILVEASM